MARFADYLPGPQRRRPAVLLLELTVRLALANDLPELALMAAESEDRPVAEALNALESLFAEAESTEQPLLWLAQWQDQLLGFAKLEQVEILPDTPPGWYLGGVVVAPRYRRMGVGRALTQARFNWLRSQALSEVFCCIHAQNLPGIDLHTAFGFLEIRRDAVLPGPNFPAEQGILFRAELPPLPLSHSSVAALWQDYLATLGESPAFTAKIHTAWHFCDNQTDADHLAELVKTGIKRATTSLYHWYQNGDEPLPKEGEYSLILNWQGEAQCLIQTQSVEILPFEQVSADFAATEGEGDGSLDYWRRAHIAFFERELLGTGIGFEPQMPVVCEVFKRVF